MKEKSDYREGKTSKEKENKITNIENLIIWNARPHRDSMIVLDKVLKAYGKLEQ